MLFEDYFKDHDILMWKNVGVSMMPLLREGKDIMVIKKKTEPLKKYDAVLYYKPDVEGRGRYILHRILKINPDGTYWIVGDNCITGENVSEEHILGVLTGVIRNGKNISIDCFSYKIYLYFWCVPYHMRISLLKFKWKLIYAAYNYKNKKKR